MRFVTGAFGARYHRYAQALARSFSKHSSGARLVVATDATKLDGFADVLRADWHQLYTRFGVFYSAGMRRCIGKVAVLEQVARTHPSETLCWIDADMLVLDDITDAIDEGAVTVMAHGRRTQPMDCGGGLVVPAHRFAIGGLYALPASRVRTLVMLAFERPKWKTQGEAPGSGDQLVLNHFVRREERVRWLNDLYPHRIFNLESSTYHPKIGDPALGRIEKRGEAYFAGNKRLSVMTWTQPCLEAHLQEGFRSFQAPVREAFQAFYRP